MNFKTALTLFVLLAMCSCAPRKKVVVENDFDPSSINGRLTDLELRVQSLEMSRVSMISSINSSQEQIDELQAIQGEAQSAIDSLQSSVEELSSLTQAQSEALSNRIDAVQSALDAQIAQQSSDNYAALSAISDLSEYVDSLVGLAQEEDSFLRGQIASLQSAALSNSAVDANQASQIAALQAQMSASQSTANSLASQIVALQQNANIAKIIDPCGDGAGFDEVIFKMADGRYVGSFSENANGKNTRWSVLTAGSYQTTDDTNCHFSVSASGAISW